MNNGWVSFQVSPLMSLMSHSQSVSPQFKTTFFITTVRLVSNSGVLPCCGFVQLHHCWQTNIWIPLWVPLRSISGRPGETYVGLPAVYTLHVIGWSSQLHLYEHRSHTNLFIEVSNCKRYLFLTIVDGSKYFLTIWKVVTHVMVK